MSSCCETVDRQPRKSGVLTVALAGNPNSGKTTLFNGLTGLRQKVANYPGVTVEKKTGRCQLPGGEWADIIDLPGTYSLISRSPDEVVAMQVLRGLRSDVKAPDSVIVVVDASNLQRNLYLVSQLIELGRPLVVALNMMDVAERRGLTVSPEQLQKELGVPVVPLVGHKRKGIAALKAAIRNAAVAPLPDWPLPEAMRDEVLLVGGALAILDSEVVSNVVGNSLPNGGVVSVQSPAAREDFNRLPQYNAFAERLLIGDRADDLDKLARLETVESLLTSASQRLRAAGIDPMQADVEAHYLWIEGVAERVSRGSNPPVSELDLAAPSREPLTLDPNLTQKVDAVLVHRFWGLVIFAIIMGAMFVTLFWVAQPIMDAIQNGITALGDVSTRHLPDGPLKDLLTNGVFGGVGTVVVFVPQMLFSFSSSPFWRTPAISPGPRS